MHRQYTNMPAYYSTYAWQELRREILRRDRGKCQYCGDPAVTADHVIPRKVGGPDATVNLVAVCGRCNKLAGGLIFNDVQSKKQWVRFQLGLGPEAGGPISPEQWEAIRKVLNAPRPKGKKRRR